MTQLPYMLGPNYQDLDRLVANNEFELQAHVRNTLRLLRPQKAIGRQKDRFGSANRGGYVHLADFEDVDTALILGSEHDIEWGSAVAERGPAIYQFTHNVNAPRPENPRMAFFNISIGPRAEPGVESIASLVERFDKKSDKPNIFLKIDLAGAEWSVLDATDLDAISRFTQIVCTLHNFQRLDELSWRQTCFRALRKLSKFYAPIHVHADNSAGMAMVANVHVPDVLEVTFANRGLYEFEDSNEVFPGILDAPCDPTRPDLFLGSFRYEALNANGEPDRIWPTKGASVGTPPDEGTPDELVIPAEWKARADAATERRQRLLSFGPRAAGILVSTDAGPMVVDAEDGSVGAVLLGQGAFADHEYALARSLVSPGGSVLVVGAHIGAHAVRLAKDCHKLIAIEANPRTFAFLEANVRLQGCDNVTLFNLAAGEADGHIKFLLNRDNTGGSKRQPVSPQFYYLYDQPEVIEVPSKRLDNLLGNEPAFDLVFMDIEGSEYFAMQGMQKILSRSKAFSTEFISHHIRDVAGVEIEQFSQLITPHFNWMFLPDDRELVARGDIADRLRAIYRAGRNYDCLYFLKDLEPAWLERWLLPDPTRAIA